MSTAHTIKTRRDNLVSGRTRPGRVTRFSVVGDGKVTKQSIPPEIYQRINADAHAAKIAREKMNLSQLRMAELIGVSLGTYKNWEQGHRQPHTAARVLLRLAARNPKAVREAALA